MKRFALLAIVLLAASLIAAGCRGNHPFQPGKDKSPNAEILSPVSGATFIEGDTILFSGFGMDHTDHLLPEDSLLWVSDKDGLIGTGSSFRTADLSINPHDVTLTATDKHGRSDTATVRIYVNEKPPPTTVLLCGSSYFLYNNLPKMLSQMFEDAGKDVIVEMSFVPAGMIDDQARHAGTDAKIKSRQWDFVVIQGEGSLIGYPDTHNIMFPPFEYHDVRLAFNTLRDKIRANCADTKMVFAMPWAFEDGTAWLGSYDEDYFEMQQHIYDNTLMYSDQIPFITAPVGWAWNEVMKFDSRLHYLFWPDWNHPSPRGTYLTACVIYSTLFQESTEGLTFYATIPAEEAIYFQKVASDMVLNDLELWNIVP